MTCKFCTIFSNFNEKMIQYPTRSSFIHSHRQLQRTNWIRVDIRKRDQWQVTNTPLKLRWVNPGYFTYVPKTFPYLNWKRWEWGDKDEGPPPRYSVISTPIYERTIVTMMNILSFSDLGTIVTTRESPRRDG